MLKDFLLLFKVNCLVFHAKRKVKLNVANWQLQSSTIAIFVGSDFLQPLQIFKLIKCAKLLKTFDISWHIINANACTLTLTLLALKGLNRLNKLKLF